LLPEGGRRESLLMPEVRPDWPETADLDRTAVQNPRSKRLPQLSTALLKTVDSLLAIF